MYKFEEKLMEQRWFQRMAENMTLVQWAVILFFMLLLLFSFIG